MCKCVKMCTLRVQGVWIKMSLRVQVNEMEWNGMKFNSIQWNWMNEWNDMKWNGMVLI